MTPAPGGPPRHELPEVDTAALAAARGADRLLAAANERGLTRWQEFLAPIPDVLRDGDLRDVRAVARKARSAYGARDSIRDYLPREVTEPFLDQLDKLLKVLAREAAERGR